VFRTLGGVDGGVAAVPSGAAADVLRAEFERVLALKDGLRGETESPVSPTGRRTTAAAEAKLRALVASVEGASRIVIGLGLLEPGQVRALWSEAMARGLYDGWDGGQSASGASVGGAEGAPRLPDPEAPAVRVVKEPRQSQPPGDERDRTAGRPQ
jgi:hypothetical protein